MLSRRIVLNRGASLFVAIPICATKKWRVITFARQINDKIDVARQKNGTQNIVAMIKTHAPI
jgi:hypothetical protein